MYYIWKEAIASGKIAQVGGLYRGTQPLIFRSLTRHLRDSACKVELCPQGVSGANHLGTSEAQSGGEFHP